MRWLNGSKMRLLFGGVVLCSTFALPMLLIGQAQEASNNHQESSEVVIMIAGQEHRYQPRPDLGFVVLAQGDSDAIDSVHRDISLFTQNEIKSIGGRGRQGLWIIERRQSAAQNKVAIKTLRGQRQVRYAAPLFSCAGGTVAIIPEVVVRVTPDIRVEQLRSLCLKVSCTIIKPMEFTTQEYLLGVAGLNAEAVFRVVVEFNEIGWIEWAAPNTAFQPKLCGPVIPNDEYFPMQWHLHNTGQFGSADINAPEAWEITTGDPNIVVVIHDCGVELDHPDLINNLVPGYDFYDDDDSPNPLLTDPLDSHGTACAGLVAAEGNNGIGVVGVAYNCKIMPIRDAAGDSYITWAEEAEAVRWSAVNNADILSNSWGVESRQPIFHSAIVDVTKPGGIGRDGKGCVVFAAAGNDGSSIRYPAANPEVISVGATDYTDEYCYYSNYGSELDIVAPSAPGYGVEDYINSQGIGYPWTTDFAGPAGWNTYDGKVLDYSEMAGTSASCPIAAGVAALILSIEPDLTNEEVRHFLERSAKDLGESGRDDYYGWGRVDARAALDMVLAKRCDLNNDWKVDDQDLAILNAVIDTNDLFADIAPPAKRDGIVDEQDLELMMQYLETEIPEIGLIAHWKLDESEGSIAYDSAGVAYHDGTLMGNPVWQPDGGMVTGTLQFDGIDDYVRIDPVLNPADREFSVFAWIKGGAPGQVIISQIDGANWLLADPSGGNLMTELKSSGRGSAALLSQTAITDGNWLRIGFVWDGSNRILYVDDVEVARDTQTDLGSSEGGLYIGAGQTLAPASFFSGLIDDIRIYNRAVAP